MLWCGENNLHAYSWFFGQNMTFASPKNLCAVIKKHKEKCHKFPLAFDLRIYRFGIYRDYYWALYIPTEIPSWLSTLSLGYLYQRRIIDQDDSFRYFRILMSTWRDSICENTFETLHDRFIHEDSSVLITTPLDQIQQNLLRKETCQTTAKPADIVLQTFEEYPTPP